MIHLEAITWDNLPAIQNLTIPKAQQAFVQTISTFLAQSYVNLKSGFQDESLAVYDDDTLIGYAKLVFVPKGEEVYDMPTDSFMIDALIIDQAHQGKGYGKPIMDALVKLVGTLMHSDKDKLSLVIFDDNERAIRLPRGCGFTFLKKRNTKKPMSVYTMNMDGSKLSFSDG